MGRTLATSTSALLALSLAIAVPTAAQAQEITATGKGIVGGTLLGAEVVTLTEAAIGVEPAWAYAVGGLGGGALGGVGGYFLEQSDSTGRPSMYLLAAGMTLVIPTTVAVLSATAYEPPVTFTEDRPEADATAAAAELRPPRGRPVARRAQLRPRTGTASYRQMLPSRRPAPAVVGYDDQRGMLSLSVPALQVGDTYTPTELAVFGVRQRTEFRLPVLSVVF